MFYYSERPNTFAQRKLEDNIPTDVKKRRLIETALIRSAMELIRPKREPIHDRDPIL